MDGDDANGTRLLVGLYQLCHFLYPELFPKDESEKVNREYWTIFQGINP
jgi:hypothetical protein